MNEHTAYQYYVHSLIWVFERRIFFKFLSHGNLSLFKTHSNPVWTFINKDGPWKHLIGNLGGRKRA